MDCSLCGSTHVKIKFNMISDRQIFACSDCDIQFLSPQLNDQELIKLYSENYYFAWGVSGNEENESTKRMKIATFQLRLSLILQYIKKGKILDVGCATGYFLETAKEKGFDPFGVEFSEYSSAIAKKKFGEDNIFWGTLETSHFNDNMFDVIAMSDLIEHVRIPEQTLSKASKLLSDNGVIMIMTPDARSLSNMLMKKKWTHYKLEHFFYFSKKSIICVADKCGLSVVHFEKSKKALNFEYLHTQYKVYKHWLLTPAINFLYFIFPKKLRSKNFYFSIGEMVVILKKKQA